MTDNEAAISELADGTLVLNSRNYLGTSHYGTIRPYGQSDYGEGYNYSTHPPHRGLSFSTDSGATVRINSSADVHTYDASSKETIGSSGTPHEDQVVTPD